MENQPTSSNIRSYFFVFITLAIITAVEVLLTTLSLPRQTANIAFLTFSLAKVSLVAAFFMHLRSDAKLYTYIFLLPAVMFVLFAFLTVAS